MQKSLTILHFDMMAFIAFLAVSLLTLYNMEKYTPV